MKVFWTLYTLLFWQALALGQDLPNPVANLQTMPQDSYVIAMDNTWQSTSGSTSTFRNFNLKAYGLIVFLLNNNIKVKRVIRSGKQKDNVDFSVSCRLVKPVSELNPAVRDFKAGPFVIYGSDLLRVNIDQLIEYYNNNAAGISGITNDTAKVAVYKTVADVQVDVRHDLAGFKPKAAILTDGGNDPSGVPYYNIHLRYMSLAGVPSTNYTLGANSDLVANCFTFASEPHNDYRVASVVSNIKNFVLAGGNFLAQCAAIENYEALGLFQSSAGITRTNTTPAAVYYPNADLSLNQYEGAFSIRQGGSLQNWRYGTSSFSNHAHALAANTNGFVNNTSLIGVSASKLTATNVPGGMVFYLGNHQYTNINDYNHINGIRIYLNALLTPSNTKNILAYAYNADCNAGAMKVSSFNGPAVAYPVQFYLYEDKGTIMGAVDPGDPFVGAASVASPGVQAFIPLGGTDPNADFVMRVIPSASCYKPEQVSPAPCRLVTLPASLKNFTALRNGKHVLLNWQTLTEQNNHGFYVQQLVQGEWRDIQFVPSLAVGGNSTDKLQYQAISEASFTGTTQFRIKMQGLDKAVHYSDIRTLQASEDKPLFSVYPNPSSSGKVTVFFAGAGAYKLSLRDMAGRLVRTIDGVANTSHDLKKLAPGIYLLSITDANNKTESQKLVIQ